jgi:RNA polymerase sigma factor (sigma-70 family)
MEDGTDRSMQMLERWVATYQPVVFRAAYLILRDPQAAEDVAQETFIRAYRAAHRLKPGDEIRGWLYRIAVNTALNEVRRRNRESAALQRAGAEPLAIIDQTDASDTRSAVAEALDRLPERLRLPIICRYYLELSERETAATLGVRPGTVKSRLFEARRVLAGDEALAAAGGAATGGAS